MPNSSVRCSVCFSGALPAWNHPPHQCASGMRGFKRRSPSAVNRGTLNQAQATCGDVLFAELTYTSPAWCLR
jgi:hypothetical protein